MPEKKAIIYRMVMGSHICPYGLKAIDLLKDRGYIVKDHHLKTRKETDYFKNSHGVQTTPQIFIDKKRIGGYTDLQAFFNIQTPKTTYHPIVAIFSSTFLMAIAFAWALSNTSFTNILMLFISISMCVLGILKLKDLESFSLQYLSYDLLAQRWVKYAYVYPFVELFAGSAMIAGFLSSIAAIFALTIGTIGAISVIKAVYIDRRNLKCACVGGNSNVPLGFISLTENLMMVAMAIWILTQNI